MRSHAAGVTLLMLIAMVVPSATATPGVAERPGRGGLAGFRIAPGPSAAANWIGSHRVGKATAYQHQPGRRAIPTSYRPARTSGKLPGTSSRATHQIAYLLSEYGARRNHIQAAAVDAAVLALAKGGRYRLSGTIGSRRIRQVGPNARWVRSYARQMIAESKKYAGPYRVTVRASDSTIGSSTSVRIRVQSARGRPMVGRTVTVRLGGSTWTGHTSDRGRVQAFLTTATAGPATVRVHVAGLPSEGVVVRRAVKHRASGVLLAGRFGSVRATTQIAVAGSQAVGVTTSVSAGLVPAVIGGSLSVSGGSGARVATIGLIGPMADGGSCDLAPTMTTEIAVPDAGSYPLPDHPVATSGFYRWSVAVSGNEFADPASACSDPVVIQSQGAVTQARPEGASTSVALGRPFRIAVTTTGFDRSEAHTVKSRLFGPFETRAEATCDPAKELVGKSQTRSFNTNLTKTQGKVVITNPSRGGWYVWASTLSNGILIAGATSGCGVKFHVTS